MTYQVLGKQVGDIGFGLMGLTTHAPPITDEQAFAAIKAALASGCNYFNGGEFYGSPDRNSLTLLNKYLEQYPEDASQIVLNIKGGLGPGLKPLGTKENVSRSVDNVLEMLGPRGRIDQFETARKDLNIDYEKETLSTIDEYVKAGKIGGISCSEISATTLRNAVKSGYEITALETELSLFCTGPLENGILEACAEFDIPVLAYSPLGRGFLAGQIKSPDDLDEKDWRRLSPQFQGDHFRKNLDLVHEVEKLAQKKGCTSGQIAINWLLALSGRPGMPKIIPIPGSSSPDRIRENATIIDLTEEDLKMIERILASFPVSGARYPEALMAYCDA